MRGEREREREQASEKKQACKLGSIKRNRKEV
jgi:hypothetical protein